MTAHRLLLAFFATLVVASCSCDDGKDRELGDGGAGGGGAGGTPTNDGGSGGVPFFEAECGNGRREAGEACDGDDLGGRRCSDFGHNRGMPSCNPDCTLNIDSCWTSEICGNGIDDDDNGLIDCDDPACAEANGCPRCGDGVLDYPKEQCDGEIVPVSCQSRGFPLGEARCTDDCRFDFSDCRFKEHCDNGLDDDGDGLVDCDDPDCDMAWECSTCGDGRLGKGEECERTIIPTGCRDLGYDIGKMACKNCMLDMSDCRKSVCGDGIREGVEACDDGNDVDGDGCDSSCNIEGDTCDAPVNLNTLWSDARGRWEWSERTTALWKSDTWRACGPVSGQPDAIAHFTAPSTGDYEIRLQSGFDAVVWAWSGDCDMHANAPLDCAEVTGFFRDQSLPLHLEADETIWIAVSGRTGGSPPYGDFTLSVREFFCGDGVKDAVEVCDDGNDDEHDGCTTQCRPSGDTCATAQNLNLLQFGQIWRWASQFSHFADDMKPSCAKATAVDAFAMFTAPSTGRYEFTAFATGGDALLSVRDDVCTTVFSELACVDDHDNFAQEVHRINLAQGETVFLMVESPTGHNFTVQARWLNCGNGVVDHPSEECDDGNNDDFDGCSAICRIERCGDHIIQPGEECDDGNTFDGDGCSSECVVEAPEEVEPNDTQATATPIVVPPGPIPAAQVRGALSPAGDLDWWKLEVPAARWVTVETAMLNGTPPCGSLPEHDTYLRLFDDAGTLLDQNDNFTGLCSRVRQNLAPGIYFIQVSSPTGQAIPNYFLRILPF